MIDDYNGPGSVVIASVLIWPIPCLFLAHGICQGEGPRCARLHVGADSSVSMVPVERVASRLWFV